MTRRIEQFDDGQIVLIEDHEGSRIILVDEPIFIDQVTDGDEWKELTRNASSRAKLKTLVEKRRKRKE